MALSIYILIQQNTLTLDLVVVFSFPIRGARGARRIQRTDFRRTGGVGTSHLRTTWRIRHAPVASSLPRDHLSSNVALRRTAAAEDYFIEKGSSSRSHRRG